MLLVDNAPQAEMRRRLDPLEPETVRVLGAAAVIGPEFALETLATKSRLGDFDPTRQLDELKYLDTSFAAGWGRMGAVAEGFGVAYAELGESAKAIEWFGVAVNAADGSASFKAAEQLGNQLTRHGETLADDAQEGMSAFLDKRPPKWTGG